MRRYQKLWLDLKNWRKKSRVEKLLDADFAILSFALGIISAVIPFLIRKALGV
jgi:hypothetical protein